MSFFGDSIDLTRLGNDAQLCQKQRFANTDWSGTEVETSTIGFTLNLKHMKLRYIFLALLTITITCATLSAQTMSATALASKGRTARSVYNDIRHKKIQRAATTVLADRDVRRHIKIDKDLQDRLSSPTLVSNLQKAPSEFRKDPVTFAEKHQKTLREFKKYRPKWLRHKSKRRVVAKK